MSFNNKPEKLCWNFFKEAGSEIGYNAEWIDELEWAWKKGFFA